MASRSVVAWNARLPSRAVAERGCVSAPRRSDGHPRPSRVRPVDPSSRQAGRRRGGGRVALADHLGPERFGVVGGSGGGSHALACAALLPDRVMRAACVVGAAPMGEPGLDRDSWFEGMDPENVKEFGWVLAGEEVLMRELEIEHAKIGARSAGGIRELSPHQLRHGFGNRFLRESGRDIAALKALLGHSRIDTTELYVDDIEVDELARRTC